MTQYNAVAQAIDQLGGVATLAQLYKVVPQIPGCAWNTKTPQASVRRIVQLHKEIFKLKPGLYGLTRRRKELELRGIIAETPENKDSDLVKGSNHSYYQGLLLTVAKARGLDCWAPNQDRNKAFLDGTLGDLRTLPTMPGFGYPHLVRRCQTIDACWFNRRGMPDSLFEVEYSTDIQNSLLKFSDLQDFNVRMFIVADSNRRPEFTSKFRISAFYDIKDRVRFLDFVSLVKLYETTMSQQSFDVVF
jgi:hypothetical protein